MLFLLLFVLTISLFLEGTITSLPLVFICLVCLAIDRKDIVVFPVAFLAGIFLDIETIRVMGTTSLFFLISMLLIFFYQRKYEINSYPFVLLASMLGTFAYLVIFGYRDVLIQTVMNGVIAVLLFAVMRIVSKNGRVTSVNPIKAGIHFRK